MTMIIHKDDLPDIDIDKSSFVYEGNYILIKDEYMCDVLKLLGVPEINGYNFNCSCGRFFIDYPEVIESYALKSAHNACYYAQEVLNGRFELGEPLIATNAKYSYRYAEHALKGRFELGEPAIATDSWYSYWYAVDVLKGRFELGEHTILNSELEYMYRETFLCQ